MSRTKEQLLAASNQVKNETQQGANTADRIGGILYDISEHIGEGGGSGGDSVSITPTYSGGVKIADVYINSQHEELRAPNDGDTVNITPTYSGTDSVKIADVYINSEHKELRAPNGGGGGGTAGEQKTYFLNINHDVVPPLPEPTDYTGVSTNTFVKGGYTWTYINTNPGANQDTYQMWAWFQGEVPQSTSGPVRIYNSAQGGSNGEDGEETEFIYRVVQVKPTPEVLQQWTTDLANAKGSALDKDGHPYTQEDAVPSGWTDRANGIDQTNKYEYRAFRVSSLNEDKKRIWGVTGFSEPVLISNWGEKGEDGDGVEYIFYADHDGAINGAINHPENWNESTQGRWKDPNDHSKGRLTFQDNEFIAEGSDWMDDPIDLENSEYGQGSIEFVSIRRQRDGVWQPYSPPAPWSRYAKDGVVDGYTIDIVNENMPVGTDSNGSATSYTNRGWVQVYHNSTPITYADSIDENHFTYSIDTANIRRSDSGSVANISVTKNSTDKSQIDVAISSISNFNLVNAYIPIIVTLPNNTTRRMEITLYGVEAGEAGTNIDLYTSTSAIHTDAAKSPSSVYPNSITVGVQIGKGEGNIHTYISGDATESAESKGYHFGYSYDHGTMNSFTGSLIPSAQYNVLTIEMRKGDSFATGSFIDSEDIPYIRDGATGPEGPEGRGVQSVTPYYRAVASTSEKPSGNNDISLNDFTDVDQTGWGKNKPYLYRRDYTVYTNGQNSWNTTQLDRVWVEGGGTGKDGYGLIINPSYLILEEPLVEVVNADGTITYSAGSVDCTNAQVSVKLSKGDSFEDIGYTDLKPSNCTVHIADAGTDELTVEIESITSAEATTGEVSFWVTLNNDATKPYVKAIIPIYINRIGTFATNIKGDTETSIAHKTIYDGDGTAVTTYENLGTYLRSSQRAISSLEQKVNGIPANASEILQTADAISLGVTNGWKNYIKNPVAINGSDGSYSSKSVVNDTVFGEVVQITNSGGDWQWRHNVADVYGELTGKTVTWFCIVKNVASGRLDFGSGNSETILNLHAIRMTGENNTVTRVESLLSTSYYSLLDSGLSNLGNGWYVCWVSAKPKSESTTIIADSSSGNNAAGFNSMTGTWQLYYAGIVMGQGYPSIDMIMQGAGIKKAGIDITQGEIDLKAGKTFFSYYDNTTNTWKSDKIWIDNTTGTLHAVDGDFTGTIHATSGNITGDLTVLSSDGAQARKIVIHPYDTNWGASILGMQGNNQLFSLGISFNPSDSLYTPTFLMGNNNEHVQITDKLIEIKEYSSILKFGLDSQGMANITCALSDISQWPKLADQNDLNNFTEKGRIAAVTSTYKDNSGAQTKWAYLMVKISD